MDMYCKFCGEEVSEEITTVGYHKCSPLEGVEYDKPI